MSKKLVAQFEALAAAFESAAAAATALAGAVANTDAKSGAGADDGVADSDAGSKGKKAAPAKEVAAKPAKGGKAKAPTFTFDDVKGKLTELMNAKGKDAVKTILSEFGAAKLADVDEGQYADVHAKALEAINADEEEASEDDDMFGD